MSARHRLMWLLVFSSGELPSQAVPAVPTLPGCSPGRALQDCATPGVQLSLVEVERRKLAGGEVIRFRAEAQGVPLGKLYTLWVGPLHRSTPMITGYAPDPSGAMMCADSATAVGPRKPAQLGWCAEPLHEQGLSGGQFAYGEAFAVALVSTDDSVRAYARSIPYPLTASRDGCSVTGEMLTRQSFMFTGAGFQPGESLQVKMRFGSGDDIRTQVADANGRFDVLALPSVHGKRGGDASIEVSATRCRVKLDYGWGDKTRGPR